MPRCFTRYVGTCPRADLSEHARELERCEHSYYPDRDLKMDVAGRHSSATADWVRTRNQGSWKR